MLKNILNIKYLLVGIFLIINTIISTYAANQKQSPNNSNTNWNSVTWKNNLGNNTTSPSCGDEIIINGTIYVSSTIDFSSCSTPMKIIINGVLNFNTPSERLLLPNNSIIIINNGGVILGSGSGSGSSRYIEIGSNKIWAVSGASAMYTGVLNGPFSYPSVLGVKFENISTINQQNLTLIKWEVSEQVNNSFFIVEKSLNAQDWKIISSINGDGTLNESKSFSYLDFETISNIQYYRIKQVDYNGDFTYSEIVSLNSLKPYETKIYPNPAQDFVYIEANVMEQNIYISNELGESVNDYIKVSNIDPFHYQLDVSQLRSGAYIIKLNNSYLKLYKQ